MTDTIMKILLEINIGQLIAMGAITWFFYNRLDKKIDRTNDRIDSVDKKLSDRIDKVEFSLGERIDKLSDKVEDIDRRLCRIEGSLQMHGHCLFNQTKSDQKAS